MAPHTLPSMTNAADGVPAALSKVDPPGGRATRGQIAAWGLWDWGSSGFNTVIVTFVFSVYLTGTVGKHLPGSLSATTWYGISVGVAGLLIAVLAPVTGQQADAAGHRRRSLAIFSGAGGPLASSGCSWCGTTTTTSSSAPP